MTVRVVAPPSAALRVEVLDSAGQVAGSGSGSVGPDGGAIDLTLDVDLLADDGAPFNLRDGLPGLADAYAESAIVQGSLLFEMFSQCFALVADATKARDAIDAAVASRSHEPVEDCLRDARAALARRLARIGHLEARNAERAAHAAGESRAT
jgi:hypothetical protein